LLDQDNPEQCIRETEEETGYRLTTVNKVMERTHVAWNVTIPFEVNTMKAQVSEGGGLEEEQRNIEVLK
jgi:8-oxo-dGTP pyrophosphatase MutT (NUDIX family)